MKHLKVNIVVYEGFSHCGEISTDGEAKLEISDEVAEQLLALIKSNDGEVDQDILEEEMPELYDELDSEGRHIDWEYWVIDGYECGYYGDRFSEKLTREEILERYGDQVEGDGYNGCEYVIKADCIS